GLSVRAVPAAVPATLVDLTVKAATSIAEGGTAVLVVSTRVAALTQGVLNVMFMSKLKVTSALVVAALAGIGIGFHSLQVKATDQDLPPGPGGSAPQKVATKETAPKE